MPPLYRLFKLTSILSVVIAGSTALLTISKPTKWTSPTHRQSSRGEIPFKHKYNLPLYLPPLPYRQTQNTISFHSDFYHKQKLPHLSSPISKTTKKHKSLSKKLCSKTRPKKKTYDSELLQFRVLMRNIKFFSKVSRYLSHIEKKLKMKNNMRWKLLGSGEALFSEGYRSRSINRLVTYSVVPLSIISEFQRSWKISSVTNRSPRITEIDQTMYWSSHTATLEQVLQKLSSISFQTTDSIFLSTRQTPTILSVSEISKTLKPRTNFPRLPFMEDISNKLKLDLEPFHGVKHDQTLSTSDSLKTKNVIKTATSETTAVDSKHLNNSLSSAITELGTTSADLSSFDTQETEPSSEDQSSFDTQQTEPSSEDQSSFDTQQTEPSSEDQSSFDTQQTEPTSLTTKPPDTAEIQTTIVLPPHLHGTQTQRDTIDYSGDTEMIPSSGETVTLPPLEFWESDTHPVVTLSPTDRTMVSESKSFRTEEIPSSHQFPTNEYSDVTTLPPQRSFDTQRTESTLSKTKSANTTPIETIPSVSPILQTGSVVTDSSGHTEIIPSSAETETLPPLESWESDTRPFVTPTPPVQKARLHSKSLKTEEIPSSHQFSTNEFSDVTNVPAQRSLDTQRTESTPPTTESADTTSIETTTSVSPILDETQIQTESVVTALSDITKIIPSSDETDTLPALGISETDTKSSVASTLPVLNGGLYSKLRSQILPLSLIKQQLHKSELNTILLPQTSSDTQRTESTPPTTESADTTSIETTTSVPPILHKTQTQKDFVVPALSDITKRILSFAETDTPPASGISETDTKSSAVSTLPVLNGGLFSKFRGRRLPLSLSKQQLDESELNTTLPPQTSSDTQRTESTLSTTESADTAKIKTTTPVPPILDEIKTQKDSVVTALSDITKRILSFAETDTPPASGTETNSSETETNSSVTSTPPVQNEGVYSKLINEILPLSLIQQLLDKGELNTTLLPQTSFDIQRTGSGHITEINATLLFLNIRKTHTNSTNSNSSETSVLSDTPTISDEPTSKRKGRETITSNLLTLNFFLNSQFNGSSRSGGCGNMSQEEATHSINLSFSNKSTLIIPSLKKTSHSQMRNFKLSRYLKDLQTRGGPCMPHQIKDYSITSTLSPLETLGVNSSASAGGQTTEVTKQPLVTPEKFLVHTMEHPEGLPFSFSEESPYIKYSTATIIIGHMPNDDKEKLQNLIKQNLSLLKNVITFDLTMIPGHTDKQGVQNSSDVTRVYFKERLAKLYETYRLTPQQVKLTQFSYETDETGDLF